MTASAALGQNSRLDDAPGFEGVRERWTGLLDEFQVPGMVVAIVKDGELLAIESFGVRQPAEPQQAALPPNPDTMYYIASITKTYLATAICALADDGKLTLDDPVQKHLPRFEFRDAPEGAAEKITLRDLLSHKAGLGGGGPIVLLDAYTGEITEDRYYRWLAEFRPSGQLTYSNLHYTLLGRVVEAASGMPWREYLEQRILKPASLTRTTGYASRMYGDPNCAIPMEFIDGEWTSCRLVKTDRTMHAAGGLGASAHDAARWLVLHLNDGEIDGKRIISAERIKEMRTLQAAFPQKQGSIRIMEGFGLGWQVGTFHGTPLCSHGGGYTGTQTYYAILPAKESGFVILMNASSAAMGLQDVMAVDILDRLIEGDEPIDVLEAYRRRVADHKVQMSEGQKQRKAELSKPFELTRDAEDYAGQYSSRDLGTITIAVAEGNRLNVRMGECQMDVTPMGPDAFQVMGPSADGAIFKFEIDATGGVTGLALEVPQREKIVFTR